MSSYLLRESASALLEEIRRQPGMEHRPLTERLIRAYKDKHKKDNGQDDGKDPGKSLVESWENSLPPVINALHERGLGQVEVFIEFGLPHTDADVDMLLAGVHPGSGAPSYVLIELKQQRTTKVHPERSVAVDLGFDKWKLHPVRQVQKYCDYLMQYKAVLRGKPNSMAGAVLMHNAHDNDVRELFELPESDHGRLYTMDRLESFRKLLGARLAPRPGGEAAQALIDSAEYEPPKITDVNLAARLGSGERFELLDEQEMAHQDVHEAVRRVHNGGTKEVIIVRGGPGSGKSAIALELRRTLDQAGWNVVHASGAKALTLTLRETYAQNAPHGTKGKLKKEATRLFTYFNQLKKLPTDSCDVVICDEAHRIRRHSIDRYTPREERENPRPQADEIIEAARVPVFLLDDWQSLRPGEVGTAEYLVERAKALGLKHTLIDLGGMFRAQGSAYYRDWVLKLLSVGIHTPQAWVPDGRMQVHLADTPQEMEDFLSARRLEGASTRAVAGFCWPWSNPDDNGELIPDVTIDGWQRPWNVKAGYAVEGAPDADFWATDPRGADQIGCVYTSQTFEFDWVGIIIGPDLLWRGGQFIVDRTATHDPELRPKSIDQADIERCVRNAYHVLLTRGIMGVVVYATDEATRDALRGRVITSVQHPLPSPMRKIARH
ncbi:DNA/RNA helicase domain-containing protein [Streptomyces sp. NPDC094147]|uniref:DNA/RNA helicase domain-containing protein n=1 Tax=Streptomyces sp. NPDC094147 TaxID=3366057 RepID=UPI00380E908B